MSGGFGVLFFFSFPAVLNPSTFAAPKDGPGTHRSLVVFFGHSLCLCSAFQSFSICLLEASSSCSFSPVWRRWQFLYIGCINTCDHFPKHYSKLWVSGVVTHCCCSFWSRAQVCESQSTAELGWHRSSVLGAGSHRCPGHPCHGWDALGFLLFCISDPVLHQGITPNSIQSVS